MQTTARKLRYGIYCADLLWMCSALAGAYATRDGLKGALWHVLRDDSGCVAVIVASLASWTCIYRGMRLDGFQRGWDWGKVLAEVTVGIAILSGVIMAVLYATENDVPRVVLLYYTVLLGVGFLIIRILAHLVLAARRGTRRRVVIIGNGRVARELSHKLQGHGEMMCDVVGYLYPSPMEPEGALGDAALQAFSVPALGALDVLKKNSVTDVIVVLSGQHVPNDTLDLVGRCREAGIGVSVVPHSYELYLSKPLLIDLDGLPIIFLGGIEPGPLSAMAKRGVDFLLGAILSLLTAPLVALLAVQLKVSKGRALASETRCGKGGALFAMYRLNVVRNGPCPSRLEDVLDSLSLSELPQLWNVLRGEMSLVGPRPEDPERVKHYSEWQRQRLAVRPGITGLAQVHGLRDQSSSEEKARFDLEYIVAWSPVADLVLILQTMWTLAVRLYRRSRASHGRPAEFPRGPYTGFANADRAHSSAD